MSDELMDGELIEEGDEAQLTRRGLFVTGGVAAAGLTALGSPVASAFAAAGASAIKVAVVTHGDTGAFWSAGYQPTAVEPDSYEASFFEDRVEISRRDGSITTRLEVAVSPEDDVEVRRVTISNLGNRAREIELTSYAEIVLAPEAADAAHPAFSNLFVQTEFVAEIGAVLATRRRGLRARGEERPTRGGSPGRGGRFRRVRSFP